MKEKKNIDRLFQEQLKDFEAAPNEQVWCNIAAELNNDKKKRRVIPLWLKYSGIAATLLLGIFGVKIIGNKDFITPNNTVVNKTIPEKTRSIVDENKVVQENNQEVVRISTTEKSITNHNASTEKLRTTSHIKTTQGFTNLDSTTKRKAALQQENAITNATQNNNKTIANPLVIIDKSKIKTDDLNKNIATTNLKETVTKTSDGTNELEELLKDKTENKNDLAEVSKSKWQISPNVAPVYLQTNSGGSAIDNQFSNNDKSAKTSLSFGLGVQYALTSKLTIRSGINKVALDYNTNDIIYAPSLVTNSIASINYDPNNVIEVKNEARFNTLSSAEKNIQKTENGAINQKMGYFELPMEVSYALLDKKIGISIIGGFSTLFLNENKISLISSESNLELGEANNLNKIHLSSNFGVGFNYQLVPSLQFHFEPMVKYQWNTFSSNSNNFKPVFLGLYSGVSYRF
ncbi:hypothetical protein [Flavobacterium ovatum]|uniref:hypothetical protein n=1 Tax=Flavobacterium ovatum TaxID=1928857 RepID=UPI00344FB871